MLERLIRYFLLCLLILLNYAIKAQTHTITTLPLSVSTICPGSQISISFTRTGEFDVTNYYSVQLSDGGSYTTLSTGTAQYNSRNNTYTITSSIPSNQAAGSTYSIRITASNPAVIGTPSLTKLTIKTKPVPPIVVSPQARCQQVCRSSATCAYTFSGTPSTGASLKWYDSNGNPLTDYSGINSPNFISLYVNNFQVGQNQLFVSQILDGCESDKVSLLVTINPNMDGGPSNASDVSKYAVCQGNGTVSLDKFLPTAPTGFTVFYYKDGDIGGASSIPPNISIESATTYLYRAYYLSDKGCRNLYQNDGYVFARINPKPNSPVADAIQLDCQRRTANDAFTNIYFQKITGSTPRIYDSNKNLIQEGGTLGSEPNGVYYAFSKPVAGTDNGFVYPVSENLYYLSQIVDGCESDKTSTLSRILYRPANGPKPANEFSNGFGRLTYCQGAQSFPLSVNGHSTPTQNYTVTYSYNNIVTTTSPIPDTNVPGSISYMMRLVPIDASKGCSSPNGSVTYLNVTINSRPGKPTVPNSAITFFQFQSTSPLTAEGQNLKWYSQDGNQYAGAPTVSTNQIGIFKFYVSQTISDCESERTEIIVDVIPASAESVRSIKNGQWTDPTVWSTSKVPTVADKILLLHTVTVPTNGFTEGKSLTYGINGHLIFESSMSKLQLGFTVSSTPLKLKTVQGGTLNTTYTYDSQNRLVTVSKADGSLAVISYGDPAKKYVYTDAEINYTYYIKYPNPSDQTSGEISKYPLLFDGTNFQAKVYPLVNSKIYSPIQIRYITYNFDTNKHLSSAFRFSGSGPTGDNFVYTYTDGNLTKGDYFYSGGHFHAGPYINTFDNKINPFFGLLDPDNNDLQQYSLNNLISVVTTDAVPIIITTYEYEYNSYGLPIKRTKKQNNTITEVLTFTYE